MHEVLKALMLPQASAVKTLASMLDKLVKCGLLDELLAMMPAGLAETRVSVEVSILTALHVLTLSVTVVLSWTAQVQTVASVIPNKLVLPATKLYTKLTMVCLLTSSMVAGACCLAAMPAEASAAGNAYPGCLGRHLGRCV